MINEIKNQIFNMVGRAIIKLIDDSAGIQKVQISGRESELLDQIDRVQEYGFTSKPKDGAECVLVALNGERDQALIIATEDKRYRIKDLGDGEVVIYDYQGQKIHFKKDNSILVDTSGKVTVDAPLVEMTGKLIVDGDIFAKGDVRDKAETNTVDMAEMRTIYNTHTHPGDSGGTTGTATQQM